MQRRFTLRAEHIQLMRKACVKWYDIELGAPGIDCKKPYGNSGSGVFEDIAGVLGIQPTINDENEKEFTDSQIGYMRQVHTEVLIALEIMLQVGSLEVGRYESIGYSSVWERIEDD